MNIFIHAVSHSKFSARQSAFISSCDTGDEIQIPATVVVAAGAESVAIKDAGGNVFDGKKPRTKGNSDFREEKYTQRDDQ